MLARVGRGVLHRIAGFVGELAEIYLEAVCASPSILILAPAQKTRSLAEVKMTQATSDARSGAAGLHHTARYRRRDRKN